MRLKCGKVETSFEYSSPKEFCQSQWQKKEKSLVYLIYRWIVATFFIFSVIVSVVNAALHEHLHVYFIYLTHWNLVFTMITAVWSACLVTRYHYNQLDLQEQMTKELKWFWFLSTSSNMYAFLVSMIYWGILYKSDLNKIDLNNIVVHATNSLVVLFNLALVKQPERFGLFIYPLCCGCVFLFFSWIYPFLGGKNRWDKVWTQFENEFNYVKWSCLKF